MVMEQRYTCKGKKKLFSNRKKLEKVIVKSCMHVNLELLLCTVFVLDIHIWPRSTLVAQTSPRVERADIWQEM